MASQLEAIQAKDSSTVVAENTQAINEFKVSLQRMKELLDEISKSTVSSMATIKVQIADSAQRC